MDRKIPNVETIPVLPPVDKHVEPYPTRSVEPTPIPHTEPTPIGHVEPTGIPLAPFDWHDFIR